MSSEKRKQIIINFIPCKEIHEMLHTNEEVKGIKDIYNKIYRDLTRGFIHCAGKEIDTIYVCEEHFDLTLIAHECGHSLLTGGQCSNKKDHTWWFTTMNRSGVFRWFTNPIVSLRRSIAHYHNRIIVKGDRSGMIVNLMVLSASIIGILGISYLILIFRS